MTKMDIVEKLRSQIGDDPQYIFDREALFRIAAAEIERLRDFVSEFAAEKFPATRHFSGPSPEDELDETTPLAPVEAWQDDARVALQEDKTDG